MKTSPIWRITLTSLLWGTFVFASYTPPPWELSLAHLKKYWVEQLSAGGTELKIKFRPPTGLVSYYRLNDGPRNWFQDETTPAPLDLTIHIGDKLDLGARHAHLYLTALPEPVSSCGFALQEEMQGRGGRMDIKNVFMVLVGTNGIARGIGENGIILVPASVEAVKRVLADAGLTPAPPTLSRKKDSASPSSRAPLASAKPSIIQTQVDKSSQPSDAKTHQGGARSNDEFNYIVLVALLLIVLGVLFWFVRKK